MGVLSSSTGNTIGGTGAGAANIIGFNTSAGVSIGGTGATGDLVIGNLIGTDSAGDNLHNSTGVSISSTGNTIGGTSSGSANIIGFNTISGVAVSAADNVIAGNFIGTDPTNDNLGNAVGVSISASASTIGGTTSAAANVIGFNTTAGVAITAANNLVIGNFIGADSTGDNLGNATGVSVGASDNTIGGTSSGSANIIGFNTVSGVAVSAADNVIAGNFIGTDSVNDDLGNSVGVSISASGNTIGGTNSAFANTIGFSTTAGVAITAANNLVAGNFIGTNSAGDNLHNSTVGILISGYRQHHRRDNIWLRQHHRLQHDRGHLDHRPTDNLIAGNFIGTDPPSDNLGNSVGVSVSCHLGITIGGTTSSAANVIGFNTTSGVTITAANNLVAGNFIGTDSAGDNLHNSTGVSISGTGNTIGGMSSGSANAFIGSTRSRASRFRQRTT